VGTRVSKALKFSDSLRRGISVWARKGARQTAGHREGFLYLQNLGAKRHIFPPTSPRTDSLGSVTPLENGVSAVTWHLNEDLSLGTRASKALGFSSSLWRGISVWARKGARQTAGHREGFLYLQNLGSKKKDTFSHPQVPALTHLGSVTPLENGVLAVLWHLNEDLSLGTRASKALGFSSSLRRGISVWARKGARQTVTASPQSYLSAKSRDKGTCLHNPTPLVSPCQLTWSKPMYLVEGGRPWKIPG